MSSILLSEEEARAWLASAVDEAGSIAAFCRKTGAPHGAVSRVISNRAQMGPYLAAAVGLQVVRCYTIMSPGGSA